MNFETILLIFLCITSSYCKMLDTDPDILDTNAISTAITSVCDELFIKKSINLDLIFYGEQNYQLNDTVDSFMSKMAAKYSIRQIPNVLHWNHFIMESTVILVQDFEALSYFSKRIHLSNNKREKLTILIYVDQSDKNFYIPSINYDNQVKVNIHFLLNLSTNVNFFNT